jgi:hypothetical protein
MRQSAANAPTVVGAVRRLWMVCSACSMIFSAGVQLLWVAGGVGSGDHTGEQFAVIRLGGGGGGAALIGEISAAVCQLHSGARVAVNPIARYYT